MLGLGALVLSLLVGSANAVGLRSCGSPWTRVASGYTAISFDGTNVCVLSKDHEAVCGSTDPSSWKSVASQATDVVTGGDEILWTNGNNPVALATTAVGQFWNGRAYLYEREEDKWRRLATDGTSICAYITLWDISTYLECAQIDQNDVANRLDFKLLDISISGDSVYAVADSGVLLRASISRIASHRSPSMLPIHGISLKKISSDANSLCGIDENGAIRCALVQPQKPTDLTWSYPIKGSKPWIDVANANGVLYAIDDSNTIYTAEMSSFTE
uniref:Secreted protein n=1 Tax=Achlya hypogyna TaxID=1202772 RepID=A0A0A7CNH3_ACHHY|nr:secreted protein [Achlya hypogyna]